MPPSDRHSGAGKPYTNQRANQSVRQKSKALDSSSRPYTTSYRHTSVKNMHAAHSKSHRCPFCPKTTPTAKGLTSHIQNKPECRAKWLQYVGHQPAPGAGTDGNVPINNEGGVSACHADESQLPHDEPEPQFYRPPTPPFITAPNNSVPPNRNCHVEEVPDEDFEVEWGRFGGERFVESFPGHTADVLGCGETTFERWRREQVDREEGPFSPYADEDEWGLAKWLIENVGQGRVEEFLKLPLVSTHYRIGTVERSCMDSQFFLGSKTRRVILQKQLPFHEES